MHLKNTDPSVFAQTLYFSLFFQHTFDAINFHRIMQKKKRKTIYQVTYFFSNLEKKDKNNVLFC